MSDIQASDIQTLLTDAIGAENVDVALPERIDSVLVTDERSDKKPKCVALPTTTDDLGRVLAIANQQGWRSLPMGQGTKISWGGLAKNIDLIISTARLNQIVDHAVGDFTVTVQPGLKVADLQAQLAEKRQFLAVDPAFDQNATVGGLVATADASSLRQRYGGIRDMLIGVQIARYDGKLARAGGKVVKNVAGYDLMKLMTGSYGSLGVLSELTFRLYPQMNNLRSLLITGSVSAIRAATADIRLSGLTPVAFDVLSKGVVKALGQTGSQTGNQTDTHAVVARFQGVSEGVEEQSERLEKIAATHGMDVLRLDGAADTDFWRASSELVRPESLLCKIGLKPSAIAALLLQVDEVIPEAQVRLYGSSGLGWVQFENANRAVDVVGKLRSLCEENGGFLTILQAPKTIKETVDVWGYTGDALGVMKSVKQKFDPHHILSPGRFVGGL